MRHGKGVVCSCTARGKNDCRLAAQLEFVLHISSAQVDAYVEIIGAVPLDGRRELIDND